MAKTLITTLSVLAATLAILIAFSHPNLIAGQDAAVAASILPPEQAQDEEQPSAGDVSGEPVDVVADEPLEDSSVPLDEDEASTSSAVPIEQVLEENGATIMSELLKINGLAKILNDEDSPPVSLFAPSDTAFEGAAESLGVSISDIGANPGTFKGLLNHLTQVISSADLQDGMVLEPAAGRPLAVAFLNGTIPYIEGATVLVPDLQSGPNIVHIVDRLLLSRDEILNLMTVDVDTCQCLPFGDYGCAGFNCDENEPTCCPPA